MRECIDKAPFKKKLDQPRNIMGNRGNIKKQLVYQENQDNKELRPDN